VIVVPAIDLKDGRVVRLRQGRVEESTVYGSDAPDAARRWQAKGAERLHLVDLNAALGGAPQVEAVESVIASVAIPVEVGGGVRTIEAFERYRNAGADRVVFGTVAVTEPMVVRQALVRRAEAVAVAIDARDGKAAVTGWSETSHVDVLDLAQRVREWGVSRIQFTTVVRDGMLAGPDLPAIEQMARVSGLRVTAAGGIARLDDLLRMRALESLGVDEVVVGRALYDGCFTLAEARAALGGAQGGGA
jgi:phosphoribosylformimino-5-aminoimidazole carboxamide ribotide isomerase